MNLRALAVRAISSPIVAVSATIAVFSPRFNRWFCNKQVKVGDRLLAEATEAGMPPEILERIKNVQDKWRKEADNSPLHRHIV